MVSFPSVSLDRGLHPRAYPLKDPIPKVYEDDYFVVFNKPPGLLVIPTPKKETNTLVDIVNREYPAADQAYHLHPCHRLDRETSGVILFAKGKHAQKAMMDLFKLRKIKKKYVAFVQGKIQQKGGELKSFIEGFDQKKFRKREPKKLALTRFRVREVHENFSIVEAEPVTGRTNQIRIQFSGIHHPLVGERKYALGKDALVKFKRAALHAYSLEWEHPFTHTMVNVTANLPNDMEAFLERS